ncbi:hypothetical protein ACHQM5_024541 [Ranunculus cassubicifolius]
MADWSQLPQDLLDKIATELTFCIDLLRFRSICSSWRSSISYPPHCFPNRIPICPPNPTTGLIDSGYFYLSKRIIAKLISPDQNQINKPWIIKLEQDVSDKSHLLNPLSESKIQPLPSNFPKLFDFMDIGISELGQEYVLRYANKQAFGFAGDVYREKVIFSSNPPGSKEVDYVIMTIHVSGKLAMFKLKDNTWSIIDDMPSPYDDLILYKGEFYAVDSTGRAVVVVGPSLGVEEVTSSVFGGDKKYLVELDGDLLLVDRYLSIGSDDHPIYLNNVHDYEIFVPANDDTYVIDTTVQFKIYKLDWREKSWVEVKTLGDHMLFLGDNCSFSTTASDISGTKGNCIYFTDRYFQINKEEDGAFRCHCIGVFNLEDASIGPLAAYPGYSQLFWPPPTWITSQTS